MFSSESSGGDNLLETLRRSCALLSTSQQKIIELQRKEKEKKKEITGLNSEIEKLRAENAILRKENNDLKANQKAENESDLLRQLTEMTEKCKRAEGLGKYYESETERVVAEFHKMVQKHKKEVASLQKTIKTLGKEVSNYSFTEAKHNREIERLRISASDSQIQLEILKAELEESRQSFEKLDAGPDSRSNRDTEKNEEV